MSFSRHWKERKSNNRGSSLALVITVMAIIGILAMILMSVSLITFRMKQTYNSSQKNFYDAESVLDDIKIGLQQEVADSAGVAYTWTLENYSKATEEERKQNYLYKFQQELVGRIQQAGGSGYSMRYDADHLKAMVTDEVKAGAKNALSSDVPMVTSADGNFALNQDVDSGTYTIKNLLVRYVDNREFMTEIRTDIVLACPKLDLTQKGSSQMDLTSYVFIANNETIARGGIIDIKGNAYLGNAGTDFSTCTVNFSPSSANGGGKLVTAGQFYVRNGAKVSVADGYSTWAHELYVDSAESLSIAGNLYLNDDVVLTNSLGRSDVGVSLSGRLYAYGNTSSARSADAFLSDSAALQDLDDHPANYSSAILVNGRNATLDMGGLDNLIIAGNAYVAAGKEDTSNSDVQMGESIALKASQRAYLVPSQYIAPFCVNGGLNPMSADDYSALLEELRDRLGYGSTSDIKDMDFLRNSETAQVAIPVDLKKYHVTGIQREVYQVMSKNGTINMVYFFLVFETEADAMKFGDSYFAEEENLSAMQARVDVNHYNTKITYPSQMYLEMDTEADAINDFNFYYNGSVLVPANSQRANTKIISGQCTKLSSDSSEKLMSQAKEYQNTFAALRHYLVSDYTLLTVTQRQSDIYDNLVKPMLGFLGEDAVSLNIPAGSKKVFGTGTAGIAPESQMTAVVVNGDYTVTGSGTDAYETCDGASLPLHLVIASGNVTVDSDFKGLIIAGGTVTFTSRAIHVSADSNLAQQALRLTNADGVSPVNYLVGGEGFLNDSNTNGSGTSPYDAIDYSQYVTYSNWTKQ